MRATTSGLLDFRKFDVRDHKSYAALEFAAIQELQLREELSATQLSLSLAMGAAQLVKAPGPLLAKGREAVLKYLQLLDPTMKIKSDKPDEQDILARWQAKFGALDSPENKAKMAWLDNWLAKSVKQLGV